MSAHNISQTEIQSSFNISHIEIQRQKTLFFSIMFICANEKLVEQVN